MSPLSAGTPISLGKLSFHEKPVGVLDFPYFLERDIRNMQAQNAVMELLARWSFEGFPDFDATMGTMRIRIEKVKP